MSPPAAPLRRAILRRWRETWADRGLFGTVRELAGELWAFGRELTPRYGRAWYGDLDYDWEHGTDTTRSNVGAWTQLRARLAGTPYHASEPYLFDEIMRRLPIRFGEYAFIDLGCGKGRALLMAAEYGFRRIVGVEIVPELCRIAEANARKLQPERPIAVLCMDAREIVFPAEPSVVYLFNPFPKAVLQGVVAALEQSLERSPRPLCVAYRFPEHEAVLAASRRLVKQIATEQFAVYAAE